MLDVDRIEVEPEAYLTSVGEVFATFGPATQDSGNVSYGVRVAGRPYFVKTAGRVDDPVPPLDHGARVELLRNAVALARACPHPACPALHGVIESPAGPMLVYAWLDGELLRSPSARDAFRALPVDEIAACLADIYGLHERLAAGGWVAVDFYDGCLLYDFASRRVGVVDLDMYHRGPFHNSMGRMFGSTRFMAPEEVELGAPIDERTTVFNLGRAAFVFLGEGPAFRGSPAQLAVATTACEADRGRRFASVAELASAWRRSTILSGA